MYYRDSSFCSSDYMKEKKVSDEVLGEVIDVLVLELVPPSWPFESAGM
ncbi:hypothetical protein ACFLV6_03095 [Chloroflexota bacterium]